MMVYSDYFEHRGAGLPVRHLEGVRLLAISPTAAPVYTDATVSMRSFAAQFNADLDEVVRDAETSQLSRYFPADRDSVHIDMGAPSPLAVAQRSRDAASGELDLRRRRNELEVRKIAMDTGHRPDEPMSLGERILRHRRRKMLWDAPEVRSLPLGDVDRFGLPARRNSHGHAID